MCVEWQENNLGISTYNIIDHEKVDGLRTKIESLNAADLDGLKDLSKKGLTDFSVDSGVGLIDVSLFAYPNKLKYIIKNDLNLGSELLLKINLNNG